MALVIGTSLGSYQILAPLGAGGMGEVYRARDSKLNRDVALKILPDAFASDPDRLARFTREAHTLAALNHPHIAHIHGLEEAGGTRALVMELVEGEDLAQRIARGPIPIDEALPIARQITEALEAAHEQGIIHRDLKPANIKLRADGVVKVLDFGLAKAMEGSRGSASSGAPNGLSQSPTLMTPGMMTGVGVILGTAAYMAPEQAKGKAVDKRADIWAFGCVLFEMLTGRPLFGGETVTETLAAVMRDALPLEALPPETPRHIKALLARCLERDAKLRLRDIGEARILLDRPLAFDHAAAAVVSASRASRSVIWTLVAGAIALAAVVGTIVWRARPSTVGPVRRLELPAAIAASNSLALAPDGSRIAYFAGGHLYVRAFDALESQDLGVMHPTSGTPFWSPDSKTIGFTAEGAIKSVPAGGGPVFVICKIPVTGRALGVAWRTDGTIVFAVWRDSLYRVPAAGGAPEVYVAFDPATEVDFHSVSALPDNRVVVSIHLRTAEPTYRVELVDPSGAHRRTVLISEPAVNWAQYAAQDYLVFQRFGANEGLWAVRFGDGPIDLTKAVLLAAGAIGFDAANDGTLVFLTSAARPKSGLVWVDRNGALSPIAGSAFDRAEGSGGCCPALSPDGRRAAFSVPIDSRPNLVVRDLDTGVDARLTFQTPDSGVPANPSWWPSGDRLLYITGVVEAPKIVERRADGTGGERDITAGRFARVSPDGHALLYLLDDRGRGRFRYAALSADGAIGPAQKLWPGDDEPNVNRFDLSPDGSVLAYGMTQPDGQSNIFLTQFPSGNGRWQVTIDGGTQPRFSRDGRELFYRSGSRDAGGRPRGHFNAVPVTLRPTVKLGVPAIVFDEATTGPNGPSLGWFDVASDGRFLMSRVVAPAAGDAQQRLVLFQNWIAAMGK